MLTRTRSEGNQRVSFLEYLGDHTKVELVNNAVETKEKLRESLRKEFRDYVQENDLSLDLLKDIF